MRFWPEPRAREAFQRRDLAADLTCACCGSEVPASEMDRHLWCGVCIVRERASAKRIGWRCGAVLGLALALWIVLVLHPSRMLIGGWVGVVLATFWLGGRASMEIAYGIARFRGRP